MTSDNINNTTTSHQLASLVRGLYGRVARQVGLDPSYVSRVARGERDSTVVEEALEREMQRIMKLVVRMNGNGANHNGANHNGNHNGAGHKQASKPRQKKVSQ